MWTEVSYSTVDCIHCCSGASMYLTIYHNIIIPLIIFLNQVLYALSSGMSWRPSNINFSHIDFYAAIVDFFEDTPGPVAQTTIANLLRWWNR